MKIYLIKHLEDSFSISGSEEEIKKFLKWVKDYKHGTITEDTINCSSLYDINACRLRAKRQNILLCPLM